MVSTAAEQEAERRYPAYPLALRRNFVEGVEWSESRYRELLEAAVRDYRANRRALLDSKEWADLTEWVAAADRLLLAAAAALEEA